MDEEKTKKEETTTDNLSIEADPAVLSAPSARARREFPSRGQRRNPRRGGGGRGDRKERTKPEFDQKIINIRRVARVVAGGRRFSFSVAMVAGDRRGRVGVGLGKAADTAAAMGKALSNAKKNMIKVRLTKEMSLPHEVEAKYCASRVVIAPSPGRGRVAGSSVRDVLELGGVRGVYAKVRSRSKNGLNNARAAIKALSALSVSK